MRRARTGLPSAPTGSSPGGAKWFLFKILLSASRSKSKGDRKRATFSRSRCSAGLAYSSPCRSCFSTSTFQVTGSKPHLSSSAGCPSPHGRLSCAWRNGTEGGCRRRGGTGLSIREPVRMCETKNRSREAACCRLALKKSIWDREKPPRYEPCGITTSS